MAQNDDPNWNASMSIIKQDETPYQADRRYMMRTIYRMVEEKKAPGLEGWQRSNHKRRRVRRRRMRLDSKLVQICRLENVGT